MFMRTPFVAELPNLTWYVWERRVIWGQPRLPSQDSGVPSLPNFGVLLYLCVHTLTQSDQIRNGNAYGRGMLYRVRDQPRHCICTNASRGLSAIAEFLVFFSLVDNIL